jgi:hypothetical protein
MKPHKAETGQFSPNGPDMGTDRGNEMTQATSGASALHHFQGTYRTPSGRKVYVAGVCRQLTGEDSLLEAVLRNLKQNPKRRIAGDLRVSLFPSEGEGETI